MAIVLLLALTIGTLLVIAPWLDGPILHIAGGPFKQAAVPFNALDSDTLQNAGIVELEVKDLDRPSVTVGVLVLDEKIYIPATLTPEEKRWPKAIENNPRVRLRHDGTVIEGFAYRLHDQPLHQTLSRLGAEKYDPSYFQPEDTWYFRVDEEQR